MTLRVERARPWSYEDYRRLPDDGQRHEIIDGELYVSPAPATLHQLLSRRLQFFFYQLELEGKGFIYNAPVDLVMPGCTPVQPDLVYLTRAQRSLILSGKIEGIPQLLVEILSPGSRSYDRVRKLQRYASNGVPYYLLVDPEESTLEVLAYQEGHYLLEASLGIEDTWTFEGKTLVLKELFAPLPEE